MGADGAAATSNAPISQTPARAVPRVNSYLKLTIATVLNLPPLPYLALPLFQKQRLNLHLACLALPNYEPPIEAFNKLRISAKNWLR